MVKPRLFAVYFILGIFISFFLLISVQDVLAQSRTFPDDPITDRVYVNAVNFYTRPVSDIAANFNAARAHEETELGISLPSLTMPTQAIWDSWDSNAKALYLINAERTDRGVLALTGADDDVTQIAQDYADHLGTNDLWGHTEDGTPWERLHANTTINACHDFLGVAENLAVMVSGNAAFPQDEAVAISIYNWLYDDAGSNWGHRHALLWDNFDNNSGVMANEGLFGIGYWSGGPYQGPFSAEWAQTELVVFNVFDPCTTWQYASPTSAELTQIQAQSTPTSIWKITLALTLLTSIPLLKISRNKFSA